MEFFLTYQGVLPSRGDAAAKQQIRRFMHPQLKELWRTHPSLANNSHLEDAGSDGESVIHHKGEFRFAPLICDELKLLAGLDVLFLRPRPVGGLLSSRADIDNQLKTLFDALRIPLGEKEVPSTDRPRSGEDPFFCLLDDDRRIVDLRVRADHLLDPDASPAEVRALLRVTLKPEYRSWGNMGLV